MNRLLLLLVFAPLVASAQPAGLTEVQLSTPLHAGSDVQGATPIYSPDGRYVCFIGDTETDGADELWCADTDAGVPAVRVSGILPSGTGVTRPEFNASSDRVFYIAPGADVTQRELFMVAPDGLQPPVKLNAPLAPSGADVTSYRYIPETDQLTYTANSAVASQVQLHIVSVAQPGVATVLNGPLVSGGDVVTYEIVPKAGRVVYLADQQVDGREEIYSVPFNGAGAVKINGPMVTGASIFSYDVSPDGTRVAYIADEQALGVDELYLAPITGGGSTRVSGPVVAGGDAWYFTFSPDSQWLLFTGDLAINGWRHLYSSPADGSQATPNLLATQVKADTDPPVIEVSPLLAVTADGAHVLFTSVQGNASTSRLLRAPLDGSSPAITISNVLSDVTRFQYIAERDRALVRGGGSPRNLYSIAADGSDFIPLTGFLNPDNDVLGLGLPSGVVYLADPMVDERASLFYVDYLGQATRELSSSGEFYRGVVSSLVFSESRDQLYFVERFSSSVVILSSFRLRSVDLRSFDSAELAFIGNSALVTGTEEFLRVLLSPTNRWQVLFVADDNVDEQADAFLATFRDAVFRDRFE